VLLAAYEYSQTDRHGSCGFVVVLWLLVLTADAQEKQEKKDFSYTVGPAAVVSITNNYGPSR